METPAWRGRPVFEAIRGDRSLGAVFEGLWVAGSLDGLRNPCIAIVGTRAASAYGRTTARRFAAELGAAGCCIISGLALGIDSAAHEGALESHAPTIGILGGGHDYFFPRRNRQLAERMLAAGGAVLSPYPPGQPVYPSQFLQRNGVVAALADAVVVVEAPARSGALNTASWAAGRIPVFAVPGDIDRAHVAGCHALIRDGATLARHAQDVLDDLHLATAAIATPQKVRTVPDDPLQAEILRALQGGETSLDDLCSRCGENAGRLLAAISLLEMQGHVESRAGLHYALRSRP